MTKSRNHTFWAITAGAGCALSVGAVAYAAWSHSQQRAVSATSPVAPAPTAQADPQPQQGRQQSSSKPQPHAGRFADSDILLRDQTRAPHPAPAGSDAARDAAPSSSTQQQSTLSAATQPGSSSIAAAVSASLGADAAPDAQHITPDVAAADSAVPTASISTTSTSSDRTQLADSSSKLQQEAQPAHTVVQQVQSAEAEAQPLAPHQQPELHKQVQPHVHVEPQLQLQQQEPVQVQQEPQLQVQLQHVKEPQLQAQDLPKQQQQQQPQQERVDQAPEQLHLPSLPQPQQPLPTPPQSPRLLQEAVTQLQQQQQQQQSSDSVLTNASSNNSVPVTQQQQQQQGAAQWPTLRQTSLGAFNQQAGVQEDAEPVATAAGDGRHHRSFNTARRAPSLESTVASAAVARSLQVQYTVSSSSSTGGAAAAAAAHAVVQEGRARLTSAGGNGSRSRGEERGEQQAVASLAASCASLCVQHCAKLLQHGETTVLDIGCGTGGCCFELANSFSHVLGIDGDLLNITAAKELKAHGELCFTPVGPTDGAGQQQQQPESAAAAATCVVRVPEHIDRDRVRFWHCPLPQLPPKLQPVDAVLVEDVDGHLGTGLLSVCQQLPELLSPEGVCVVVVGGGQVADSVGDSAAASLHVNAARAAGEPLVTSGVTSLEQVKGWLEEAGLVFVRELELPFARSLGIGRGESGGSVESGGVSELQHAMAYAGVFLQRP